MTKDDINLMCSLYREALHKDEQIVIFSQLFLLPEKRVKQILSASGLLQTADTTKYDKFKKLYVEHRTDYEMATICHAPIEYVKDWREINGYKQNVYRRHIR